MRAGGGDVAGSESAQWSVVRSRAVGAGLEIPNAVITSVEAERAPSVVVRQRVVVGEPLPRSPAASRSRYTEYRYGGRQ